ncbi:MAG: hypothetical protein PHN88_09150 [Ignavibacteria bacterium]|nr:hypothetical protein [Ignavibacteria bacterium]
MITVTTQTIIVLTLGFLAIAGSVILLFYLYKINTKYLNKLQDYVISKGYKWGKYLETEYIFGNKYYRIKHGDYLVYICEAVDDLNTELPVDEVLRVMNLNVELFRNVYGIDLNISGEIK